MVSRLLSCLVRAAIADPPSRVSVVFAIQAWLAETPEQQKTSSTPAYFQVGMSSMYTQPANHAPVLTPDAQSCPWSS